MSEPRYRIRYKSGALGVARDWPHLLAYLRRMRSDEQPTIWPDGLDSVSYVVRVPHA